MTKSSKQVLIKVFVTFIFAGLLAIPVLMARFLRKSTEDAPFLAAKSTLKKYGFYLEEVSRQSGVVFKHHSPKLDPQIDPILPQIASMGASVSVVDFDKDGWNDFYVTNSCYGYKNALYHNQKDGTFLDVARKMGVSDINLEGSGVSMGAVWADFDNDGYEDLFIYKWGRPELFKNVNGTGFVNVTEKSGLPGWINSNSAIWLDYDSDGYVDLFIGGYYRENIDLWHLKTTRILTESFEYSRNGGRKFLLKNNGDGTFTDVTDKVGLTSTRWTLAAGATDIDNDGYPELFIANDYGISEFYFNDKGKRFIDKGSTALIGLSPKSGMNVSFGDTYNNGHFGIYVSNITEEGILLQGNNFWVPIPDKVRVLYRNAAGQDGIEAGGWSYGAQFGDLNNDGFVDLYLANGYISGKKGTSYWYDYSKVTGGNSTIISDLKNWPAMKGRSQSGYQENKIWLNDGSSHFHNVAKYVAGAEAYDSRAVALADLWNRGVLDVIVANQNNDVMIYKNHVDLENHWIAFNLEGAASNRSAIGARVELYWDSKIQLQAVTGGIGFCSQNQHRVQFGLGKSSKVDKAVIWWPDGHQQIVENPGADRVNNMRETK
jgi:enediyne biosynthesis protein E4